MAGFVLDFGTEGQNDFEMVSVGKKFWVDLSIAEKKHLENSSEVMVLGAGIESVEDFENFCENRTVFEVGIDGALIDFCAIHEKLSFWP